MSPQELAEFRALAGLDAPSALEQNKAWADKQIVNKPSQQTQQPLENLALRLNGLMTQPGKAPEAQPTPKEQPVENIADRLNSLMRTPGKPPTPTPPQKDPEIENLAGRLNSLLGAGNFKIDRLN